MDLLILSSGSRVKLVEYFVRAFHKNNAKVYTADCSELAPSLYISDGYFIVPKIDSPNYIDTIIDICNKNNISAVMSLIDPELSLLAKNEALLKENNITPIVSSYKIVETCFNKLDFYRFCKENSVPTVETFDYDVTILDKLEKYPYFAKPKFGSASLDMHKIECPSDFKTIINEDNYIIQEFIEGKEFGVDVYVDFLSGNIVEMFIKEKIKMRAGETDKSVSIYSKEIEELVIKLLNTMDLCGPIDIDIFQTKEGEFLISEVNPRFGGGYLHAQESGCDFPSLIMNNLLGIKNSKSKMIYRETVMMKYSELIFKEI